MRPPMLPAAALALLCAATDHACAAVSVAEIFGDHMVLQQERTLPVWGWADAGERVTVSLDGAESTAGKPLRQATATTGTDGRWRVDLERLPAGTTALTMHVRGSNELVFSDALVGDVWLCSGQSNMEFGISAATGGKEDVAAADLPQLRLFCVVKGADLTPMEHLSPPDMYGRLLRRWQVCTPETVNQCGSWGGFSAVGYHFGRELQQTLKRPIGLIGAWWGGTPVAAWTSLPGLRSDPTGARYAASLDKLGEDQRAMFPLDWAGHVARTQVWWNEVGIPHRAAEEAWKKAAQAAKDAGQPEPPKPQQARPMPRGPGNLGIPTSLFNGMINPLIPYALSGVAWYQGETNSYNGREYGTLFPLMIRDWRAHWGQGDLPFVFVQVAAYGVPPQDPTRGTWAWLREGQAKGLGEPRTAMAVAIDVGDHTDIHPRNKRPVGHRLALAALRTAYGQDVLASGPRCTGTTVEGATLRVRYADVGGGLEATAGAGGEIGGFQLAGADRAWVAASARIDGDAVVLTAPGVTAPVAVRYAWSDDPPPGLRNREGLPAVPFRSDDWQ